MSAGSRLRAVRSCSRACCACRLVCAALGLSACNCSWQVCAYALRQHSLGTELQGGVLTSPFMRALQLTDGTVFIVDRHGVAYTR